MDLEIISQFWQHLILPILRLTFFITLGLFIASFIENLNWTHRLATVALPLIRLGRLSAVTGASFTLAFFSGVTANTMLAEAYQERRIEKKELVLANLFNSLPRFFLHLPTVFFLTAPFLGQGALHYVSLTFLAAILQTMLVVVAGRLFLEKQEQVTAINLPDKARKTWREAAATSWKRLRKRLLKVMKFLVPIYLAFYIFQELGVFSWLEGYLAHHAWFLSWLNPKSLGIVVLHVTAEFSAGLAAASVLLADNSLAIRDVVLALLAGNILSAPIRALRHQYPYYAGIFQPGLAGELVVVSQVVRASCVLLVTLVYYILT